VAESDIAACTLVMGQEEKHLLNARPPTLPKPGPGEHEGTGDEPEVARCVWIRDACAWAAPGRNANRGQLQFLDEVTNGHAVCTAEEHKSLPNEGSSAGASHRTGGRETWD